MKISFFFVFLLLFFTACFIWIEPDYDVHIHKTYIKNASSHNIYIQYYQPSTHSEQGYYFAYGESIPQNTIGNSTVGLHQALVRILIVDTDTRMLLKRIAKDPLYIMLEMRGPPEIVVEVNSRRRKTFFYTYHIVITDEFLHGN